MADEKVEVRFKDFTVDVEPIRFKIGDDIFVAPPVLSIAVMQDMVSALGDLKNLDPNEPNRVVNVINGLKSIFAAILSEASAKRFAERIDSKGVDAIGFMQLTEILPWLLESYGLRPTQPSSNLSAGQEDDGTGIASTDGVPSTA